MVASADQPTLTSEDGARLAAFFQHGQCYLALAQNTGQPLHVLLTWALQPHIQHTIEVMQRASDTARRNEALDLLRTLAIASDDPVGKRRAATSIVHATCNQHWSPRRSGSLSHPSRAAAATNLGARHTHTGPPPPEIPAHFKRLSTFVYSETPSRSLKPRHAIANALALIQQGDSASLHALFNHCTHHGRGQTTSPEDFEPLARERFKELLGFHAAFAAPLIQTQRQAARQDVIIITAAGEPIAFTIHLTYPMFGEREYCWLIHHCSTVATPEVRTDSG
jgi:hypothetical protein